MATAAALTYERVDQDVLATLGPPTRLWYALLALDLAFLAFGGFCWARQIRMGLAVTGLNHPVGWAVYVTNFVFWVGIAHSGTLISAILFLLRARWRTSVYRIAEAMTVFAIVTAGLFPLIHLGRPWNFYWMLPYPNQRQLWVNFRSPLVWDAFAIGTYFTVSVIFFLLGMVPDVAAIRDRVSGRLRRELYRVLSLGWRGTDRQWHHYRSAYGFLAALATPLVVSVHSVVSWDFAMAIVPGWHSTIFAPYFVAGAIFSGLAMVLALLVPLRRLFHLEAYVTADHFDNLAKLVLVTSLIVTYSYASEFFVVTARGSRYERALYLYRALGDYAPLFWLMLFCNSLVPMALWWRSVRTSTAWLFAVAVAVGVGMWLERFVIIVTSLSHDFDPHVWGLYRPRWVEVGITAGGFAWFFLWILLFVKLLPTVSLTEVKEHLLAPPRRSS